MTSASLLFCLSPPAHGTMFDLQSNYCYQEKTCIVLMRTALFYMGLERCCARAGCYVSVQSRCSTMHIHIFC